MENDLILNMKYIVYITVNVINNKIYVGVHNTENPEIFDGYLGCGVNINTPSSYKNSKTPFQFAVNRYGINSFKRIVLYVFNSKEEAYNKEVEIVTQEFINRKISNEFKMKARDINDELFEFKKDLDYFMKNQANKEKFDSANNLKLQKDKVDMLIRDINNNRQYIVRVK